MTGKRGFTLLEILLVVAAIAILAGIVIVAINPAEQLGQTRNAQRKTDVRTILSAIQQFQLRTGALPAGLTSGTCGDDESQEICRTGASSCSGLLELSELTDDQKYLTAIPVDPAGSIAGSGNGTGYQVSLESSNRVTVCAVQAELGETISATQ
jgi:type IV pilus assembly protein PilA